jgi:hypothetical protein
VDLAALSVALDRAEDAGLTTQTPSPRERPADCVYLKYAGPEREELVARRLAFATVQLRTLGGAGNNVKQVKVFDRAAVMLVLGFLLDGEAIAGCTRGLDTIDQKYWKVV